MPPRKRKQAQATEEATPKKRGRPPKAKDAGEAKSTAKTDNEPKEVLPASVDDEEVRETVRLKCNISDECGTVLLCGAACWDSTGRSKLTAADMVPFCLWSPHQLDGLRHKRFRHVASGPAACHSILIDENRKAYSLGRNDRGQCGVPSSSMITIPAVIPTLSSLHVLQAACGRNHTLVLTESGVVFSFGDNRNAQLGLGHQNAVAKPSQVQMPFSSPVVKVSCGAEFSAVINADNQLYTFGSPEYGQLGHNSDGKYFVTASKMAFNCELRPRRVMVFLEKDPREGVKPVGVGGITDVCCGNNHMVAVDDKKRVFTWGFGGYGRLGHSSANDELVPRLLPQFGHREGMGAVKIAAGSTYSMAVTEFGQAYFWGQTKMSGEATMYPTAVNDLYGWKTRAMACCNKSIVVLADESVVSWGPSPTYGELGFGEGKKSSTVPKLVDPLEGIYIHSVACGYAHTLMIARDDSDADKAALAKMKIYKCS